MVGRARRDFSFLAMHAKNDKPFNFLIILIFKFSKYKTQTNKMKTVARR